MEKSHQSYLTSIQELNLQILNHYLGPAFRRIVGFNIATLSINGVLGEVRKLELQYDQTSIVGLNPKTVVIKFGKDPSIPYHDLLLTLIQKGNMYSAEVEAYKTLSGFDFLPQVYYSGINPSGRAYTLIMQDLQQNYHTKTQEQFLNVNFCQKVIKELAKFHSKYMRQNLSENNSFLENKIKHRHLKRYIENTEEARKAKHDTLLNMYLKYKDTMLKTDFKGTYIDRIGFKQILQQYDFQGLVTDYIKYNIEQQQGIQKFEIKSLIHWDLRIENILFDKNEGFKIIDWQTVCIDSPIADVAKFIGFNLTHSQLKLYFKSLIQQYRKEFQNISGKKISDSELREAVRTEIMTEFDVFESSTQHLPLLPDWSLPFISDNPQIAVFKIMIIYSVKVLVYYDYWSKNF